MRRITPTRVNIELEALRHNYRQLKKRLPQGVRSLCVVKSNAYGHGAQRVAKSLQDEGADAFGVGTIDEGVALREAGVKKPILVLLGIVSDPMEALVRYQLTPVIYQVETAARLNHYLTQAKAKRRLPVHLKVDTGMTRLGFLPSEFSRACSQIRTFPLLEPQGLMTHLAEAGDAPYTGRQERGFLEAKEIFDAAFSGETGRKTYHLANSQASIDRRIGGEGQSFMARFGIALYGSYPLERDWKEIRLRPVLSWRTKIISLKEVPAKTPVSYNRTFVTKKTSRIAVIPAGYADGYPRNLSNRSEMLVRGKRVPVAGVVCMDLTMLDVTGVPKAAVGDEVVLLGSQGREEIKAEELARSAETISYEIFCRISERVPRVNL